MDSLRIGPDQVLKLVIMEVKFFIGTKKEKKEDVEQKFFLLQQMFFISAYNTE